MEQNQFFMTVVIDRQRGGYGFFQKNHPVFVDEVRAKAPLAVGSKGNTR
jgi:hypothetical protein